MSDKAPTVVVKKFEKLDDNTYYIDFSFDDGFVEWYEETTKSKFNLDQFKEEFICAMANGLIPPENITKENEGDSLDKEED